MKIILETERLLACRYTMEDLQDVYEMQQDPEVIRYLYNGKLYSLEEEKQRLQQRIDYYDLHPGLGVFKLLLKSDHTFIGAGNLCHLEDGKTIQIGYVLRSQHWGKGYASEITREMLRHGFQELDLQEVVGITELGNEASERILSKHGFWLSKQYIEDGIEVKEFALTQAAYWEHIKSVV
jgi:[ribosomal protein S5]-alanine N-acetyltransferase